MLTKAFCLTLIHNAQNKGLKMAFVIVGLSLGHVTGLLEEKDDPMSKLVVVRHAHQ